MQTYNMMILYDHKAQIARKIVVSGNDHSFELHPVYYAYANAAQKCCPHTKMTLVRMIMQDHPTLSSNEAVAVATGLMAQSQTRLTSHDVDRDKEPFMVNVKYQDFDYTGLKPRPQLSA